MVAGCGPKIAKLFLFIFNFSIWAAGIALITVGSYVTAKQADYQELFAEDTLVIVCALTIAIGCFTFIVGFCGCCGAMKEGVCLLKLYWFLMLLIICGEITAGVLAFVYNEQIEESMLKGMTTTINESYPETEASREAVDGVQEASKCCGASGYDDYLGCKNCPINEAVPESCCIPVEDGGDLVQCKIGPKGVPLYPDLVYGVGCVEASIEIVQDNFILIGAVCMALLVFEILTMVFTCCVIDGIQKGEFA
ncbi:CD63 antigen-like isoform X1 [Lytechinus pictus]|uniref:CD63 antigen-like isoform X1 n=1 Tax=Lytechinus pictus TaxID=7653 RepID=UPI0030B9BFA8